MTIRRIALLSIHSSPLARIGSGQAGGMNVYVRQLADGLAGFGIQVDMFTRKTDKHAAEIVTTETGVRLIHLDAGPARSLPRDVLPLHIPAAVHAMRAFVAREEIRYDVLHSHYWLSGLVASRVRDDERVPIVHMFHTLSKVKERYFGHADAKDSALRSDGERCVINGADVVVGATEMECEQIETLYCRSPERFEVIPPGVDLELFRPRGRQESRRTLRIDADRMVLFVGRLDGIKGLDVLLESMGSIIHQLPGKTRVVILGHDPVAEREPLAVYRRKVTSLGLENVVEFRGVVSKNVLPLYYSAADVLAMPSAFESFGMVALESLACETPVVAFRVGGAMETIKDGQTGFLATPGDRSSFAAKLESALLSHDLDRMGRLARLTTQRYRWEIVMERTLDLYEDLVEERAFAFGRALGAG